MIKQFKTGGKPYYYVEDNKLYRSNSDGSKTFFPFIKGTTYNKYKASPEFMKTLELAFNRYGLRVRNEYNQIIKLSGKTKPVTIKGRGTYNIPIEIFDRIVQASKNAGVSPKQGLAIAIKESSGYTDAKRINSYYGGDNGASGWIRKPIENAAGPATIVSNWLYFENSPYIGLLKGWENSGWNIDRMSEDARYLFKRHLKDYDAYDANINEDILTNMFKLPLDLINPKEETYDETVRSYANNMSYKFGGKLLNKLYNEHC